MFKYEYPVFEHKNILKKSMLDELRDYPLVLSRMCLKEYGDGILEGCALEWEKGILRVQPGLLCHGGNVYRMEEAYAVDCPPADRLVYLKVRFSAMDYERGRSGGTGEILLDENPPEPGEMEFGRFRLQEGARLRTSYENFGDYQTEYDTVNRIHVPYAQAGGPGLWPQLLRAYARELLETGTENVFDVSFAMALLGGNGHVASECVEWYVRRKSGGQKRKASNGELYRGLLRILKECRSGGKERKGKENGMGQMLLL